MNLLSTVDSAKLWQVVENLRHSSALMTVGQGGSLANLLLLVESGEVMLKEVAHHFPAQSEQHVVSLEVTAQVAKILFVTMQGSGFY